MNSAVGMTEFDQVAAPFDAEVSATQTAYDEDISLADIVHREPATGEQVICDARGLIVWL